VSKWHGGKGSKQRPIDPKLERKVFEDNWDRIFKKGKDNGKENQNSTEAQKNQNQIP